MTTTSLFDRHHPDQLAAYLRRQQLWSARTFGAGLRTLGLLAHIRKECDEVAARPSDLSEWIDIMILAMDGFWRHGGTPDGLMDALLSKQARNFNRQWPAAGPEDQPVEHVRGDQP